MTYTRFTATKKKIQWILMSTFFVFNFGFWVFFSCFFFVYPLYTYIHLEFKKINILHRCRHKLENPKRNGFGVDGQNYHYKHTHTTHLIYTKHTYIETHTHIHTKDKCTTKKPFGFKTSNNKT